MTSIAELTSRIRGAIGDPPQPFRSPVLCDGVTVWFDLPKQKIIPGNETVVIVSGADLTTLVSGTDYTINDTLGQLQLAAAPPNNSTLIIVGQCWAMFSDAELSTFIVDAVNEHCHGRSDTERFRSAQGWNSYRDNPLTLANLPAIEVPLIADLATVNTLWSLATDMASDANIQTAEGTTIDRATRYRQIMGQISALTARYQDYCAQLNVGMYRAETQQLRRTSTRTGRLVPVFKPREYDDHRLPQRELPPIDGSYGDNSGVPSPIWSGWGV